MLVASEKSVFENYRTWTNEVRDSFTCLSGMLINLQCVSTVPVHHPVRPPGWSGDGTPVLCRCLPSRGLSGKDMGDWSNSEEGHQRSV